MFSKIAFASKILWELNVQVAQFRDLLLGVGSPRDCPELRERIRKVRMGAVQEVMRTNSSLLPHVKKWVAGDQLSIMGCSCSCWHNQLVCCRCISEGTITDDGQLICLYLIARLLQRELEKCLRLVTFLPMQDMDKHFGKYIKPLRSVFYSRWKLIRGIWISTRRLDGSEWSFPKVISSCLDNKTKRPGACGGGGIGTMLTQVKGI